MDFEDVFVALFIALIIWACIALPIGRAWMRGDLMKEGYRVSNFNDQRELREQERFIGEGKWIIEVWRDGWVQVER